MALNEEQQKVVRNAAELQRIINTPGWQLAMQIAETFAKDAEKALLNCDDEDNLLGLQREARAARQFIEKFEQRVRMSASVDISEEFVTVNY